jgi:polyphosphate kinase 2 (PPK2 family)
MFETAEIGRELSKTDYAEELESLRVDLLGAQKAASDAKLLVVVLINGVDGGGKGEFLNTLYEWMDARYLTTEAYAAPTEDEAQRPEFWRFWMWLPPRGRIGMFLGSWYTEPILHHTYGKLDQAAFESRLDRINDFESAYRLARLQA